MSEESPQITPPQEAAAAAEDAPQSSPQAEAGARQTAVGSRWLRLCQGADQLEHAVLQFAEGGDSPDKAAISFLETVLEDFPKPEDPSRDVKAFAVHRLAYSVYEAVVTLGSH
ncbi:MAG TPA: hypothetical protein VLV83_13830 [Acidobacteriota bacterium]|nr:hypothetical protein [Acidobacteriota bacterium]